MGSAADQHAAFPGANLMQRQPYREKSICIFTQEDPVCMQACEEVGHQHHCLVKHVSAMLRIALAMQSEIVCFDLSC